MKSNAVFGTIALLVAAIAAAIFAYGWIELILRVGTSRALALGLNHWLPITVQVLLLVIAFGFGIGGAQLLTSKKK
jgi:hypothetical protein